MTARRPDPRVLEHPVVRLQPLAPDHLPALWRAIGVPEVFAGGFGGGPAGLPGDEAAFRDWADRYFPRETGITWVARLAHGPEAGTIVGTSSLADFDLEREHAHIGWTAWSPRVWGTAVNPAAKLLMLGIAFDHGFGRVRLQADAVNARSRAAIEKIGAVFEGVVRRDRRRADGTWRDTAVYSVLADEWPAVRARLESLIASRRAR